MYLAAWFRPHQLGELTVLPYIPLVRFRGPTSKGREGDGQERGDEKEQEGRRERKGETTRRGKGGEGSFLRHRV